jgi:hypothetical protein
MLVLSCFGVGSLEAQAMAPPLPVWRVEMPGEHISQQRSSTFHPLFTGDSASHTHSHTFTGLLIGSAVGVAATTLFLVTFCGDPDTECGADEYGRAIVIIAVPAAAAGALIGSLIRTGE